jgi:Holliday junction DNA helicase RuvA
MIGFLRGSVIRSLPDSVVLDVSGVGYSIRVPLSTFYEIERHREAGRPVELHVHTHLRQDALELFGFWTEEEKVLFEKLIGVSGIGPRLAQTILSGMAPRDVLDALAEGNATRLIRIPGVGRKTAERMVLELREAAIRIASSRPKADAPAIVAQADLVLALVNLGYKRPDAEAAVADSQREAPGAAFHELLRASLKRLSRV